MEFQTSPIIFHQLLLLLFFIRTQGTHTNSIVQINKEIIVKINYTKILRTEKKLRNDLSQRVILDIKTTNKFLYSISYIHVEKPRIMLIPHKSHISQCINS